MKSSPPTQSRRVFIRLAWLYRTLVAAKGSFTGRALAEEYEISTKQLERDIDALREAGAIETRVAWEGGRCRGRALVTHQCPFCGHQERGEQ